MMGLRAQLRATVASCAPKQTQHATSTENSATGTATQAQLHPANPHEIRVSGATTTATAAQQASKTGATFDGDDDELRVAFATPRNSQLSFTAERLTRELIAAAMKVCGRHGDDETARQQMRDDCLSLSPAMQADLLDHFNGKPANF